MVWKGFTEPLLPPLPVLVNWPVMNGTSCATLICASWLSSVMMDGVEMILVRASPRRARKMAPKFVPLPFKRPMPTVKPEGTLVMAEGFCAARMTSPMLVPPMGETKPPAAILSAEPSNTQFTPRSTFFSPDTSTMMASTSTWARRMSRRSTTDMSERMIFGGAVTTKALVSGSAQMVVPPSPRFAPGPLGVAPLADCRPFSCSFSFTAIFSASE